ncbi:hypothetical protein ACFFRR_001833 [Megaselia abdita]
MVKLTILPICVFLLMTVVVGQISAFKIVQINIQKDERAVNAFQNLVSDKINAFARFLNSLAAIKRSYGTIQINKSINVGGGVSSSSSISPVKQYPIPVYTKTIRVNTSFDNGNSIGSSSAAASASAATANVKDNEIRSDVNVDVNVTPGTRYYRKVKQYYYGP